MVVWGRVRVKKDGDYCYGYEVLMLKGVMMIIVMEEVMFSDDNNEESDKKMLVMRVNFRWLG